MKIAYLQLHRIGDMILATPAFSAIKKKFPNFELYVIASRENSSFLRYNPHINHVVTFDKSPLGIIKILFFLLTNKFEYLVAPKDHKSTEIQLLARLCRAKVKVGYNFPGHNAFDLSIPNSDENAKLNFTERIFRALSFLEIPLPTHFTPELYLPNSLDESFSKYYSSLPKRRNLLINLSAGASSRIYSLENWKKVLSAISFEYFNVIFTFMPSEAYIAKELKNHFPQIIFAATRSVEEFFALIKHCDYLISPDTSAVHVASAFSKPSIALFADFERNLNSFRPVNPNARLIIESGSDNINKIPPERIVAEINNYFVKS